MWVLRSALDLFLLQLAGLTLAVPRASAPTHKGTIALPCRRGSGGQVQQRPRAFPALQCQFLYLPGTKRQGAATCLWHCAEACTPAQVGEASAEMR